MAINYNDSRFTELEKDKNAALDQSNSTYDNLIKDSGGYYDNLINQSKEWADKQADIQNQQTEFAIDKIEQQKDKAEKDYTKEQKGAYQDYMKQSNAYGSNMQAAGQKGLGGSGWSETIQAGFYNTYQNRYAQARESYNTIVMNYDNNIKEAQLQNSSALATIYANAQKEQLELALQSFTVIKDLTLAKQDKYFAIDSEYNDRWRQIESQINTENALAEQIRQYNETLAFQKQQAAQQQANWEKEYALAKASASRSSSGSSSSAKLSDTSSNKSSSSSSSSTKLSNSSTSSSSKSSTSSSGTVKLSGNKTGYSSPIEAYRAAGMKQGPLNEKEILKRGLIRTTTYNGKTYYFAV